MHPRLTLAERVNVASRLFRMCGSIPRAMDLVDQLEAEALKREPPPFVPQRQSLPLAIPTVTDWPGGNL